jgi:dTDP-4-amino-4,6-dideoxygalactose transaminase
MCPKALREALEDLRRKGQVDRVKAILPVHLYGMPAKMDEIMTISIEYGIPVVEDAAESLGATINDKHTGTFGIMGVFSFNGNKIITTSGGGALIGQNEDDVNLARKLSTQAREDAAHYQHEMIGYNYRLSNVSAGIGRGQMLVLNNRIVQRRANFERYIRLFLKLGFSKHIKFQLEGTTRFSNRWLTAIYFDPSHFKENVCEKLRLFLEAKNIESRPLWKPMHMQPVFKNCHYYGGKVAEDLFNYGICLPSGSNLTDQDWERIESGIEEFFLEQK